MNRSTSDGFISTKPSRPSSTSFINIKPKNNDRNMNRSKSFGCSDVSVHPDVSGRSNDSNSKGTRVRTKSNSNNSNNSNNSYINNISKNYENTLSSCIMEECDLTEEEIEELNFNSSSDEYEEIDLFERSKPRSQSKNNHELLLSLNYIKIINRDNKSEKENNHIKLLDEYKKSNDIKDIDYASIYALRLFYSSNQLKFKTRIYKETLTYININHRLYNSHLNSIQYWILNEIKSRDDDILWKYLVQTQHILKGYNGLCFRYDKNNLSEVFPYMYDYIFIVDYKINMISYKSVKITDELFHPQSTYISLLPLSKISKVILHPIVIKHGVPYILSNLKKFNHISNDEILNLFEDCAYRKILGGAEDLHTIDIYVFSIHDFLTINFNYL